MPHYHLASLALVGLITADVASAAPPLTATLAVENMTCGTCAIVVKKALERARSNLYVGRLRQESGDRDLRSRQSGLGETHAGDNRSVLSLEGRFEAVSNVIRESVLTCPSCGHAQREIMMRVSIFTNALSAKLC